MGKYIVYGPYRIPVDKRPAGRRIGDLEIFWKDANTLKKKCGCYVFGMSASGSLTPYYVGKTTRTFEKECFSSHKIEKYNEALCEYKRGRPVMFFVAALNKKGIANGRVISAIEDFLLQVGLARNEELLNIKGTKKANWSITHVVRGGFGKPTKAERKFKSMMGLVRK
jgi:hypothetical protein